MRAMKELKIVDSAFRRDVFKMQLDHAEMVAIDIETTISDDPFADPPKLVSVAVSLDGETSWVFPPERFTAAILWNLAKKQTLFHNGSFDALLLPGFFGLFGPKDCPVSHDTMALAYLLGDYESKGLQSLSEAVLGLEAYKDVDYAHILDEPFEKIAKMNGEDACRTWKLFRPLADRVNEDPALLRLYRWLLMPAVNALIDVTRNGVPVDISYLTKISEKISGDFRELESELFEITPPPDPEKFPNGWPVKRKKDTPRFNPASPKQVAHILFDVFKLTPIKRTDTGAPSTDEDSLTQLLIEAQGPAKEWVAKLMEYRKLFKQKTSYIESWPQHIAADGRMHPRYKPLHVVTGRLSSEGPNIQQVPRDSEFRMVFGGQGTWVKADYSQIELRIAAWLAGEKVMLDAYRQGLDLHTMTANLILGDESKAARQVGKTLNFGLLYGAGANTLRRIARTNYGLDLTESQAYAYREAFFATYPALSTWHQEVTARVIRDGYVRSPLGRIRWLPNAQIVWDDAKKWSAIREGINMPVQSFASDLLLYSLVRLNEEFPGSIVATVHDEIDFCFAADPPVDRIKAVMEDVSWLEKFGIKLTVPVLAQLEVGTHWGNTQ